MKKVAIPAKRGTPKEAPQSVTAKPGVSAIIGERLNKFRIALLSIALVPGIPISHQHDQIFSPASWPSLIMAAFPVCFADVQNIFDLGYHVCSP